MAIPEKPRLQKLLNFRDVGISINTTLKKDLLKPCLLFRSGRPDDATPLDRMRLSSDYHLKTVIDLRTDSEHAEQAAKNRLKAPSPEDNLRIPGVKYYNINFNGRAYSTALIYQLSYWNAAKLFGLYALGYRREAISVMGENVMAKRGLIGLAEDSLQHCTAEVKMVFDVLSESANYPILIHCTQGKDRTGLTVLLILLLLGVPEVAIEKDYLRSEQELAAGKEARLAEIRSIGLPDEFAGCPLGWPERVIAWIREKYGSVDYYLTGHCGVTASQLSKIRSVLLRSEER